MRQTAEQLPYVGSAVVRSRHGLSPSCRSTGRRSGFTLVEVVVAGAILVILLIGLVSVYARGVVGFRQAQLLTLAQNMAEFYVEDIKSMAPTILHQMLSGVNVDSNYPNVGDTVSWSYDSGRVTTDYVIGGITVLPGDASYVAGGSAEPPLPTNPPLLLGSLVTVGKYSIVDGTGATRWFYSVTLNHQALSQFSRQIRIVYYQGTMDTSIAGNDPWTTTSYRTYTSDEQMKFEYEVTIFQGSGSYVHVVYRTSGTIARPYTL